MRPLSEAQAKRCEHAKTKRCTCRCGGAAHGIARTEVHAGREAYERLAEDDPHHLPPLKSALKKKLRALLEMKRRGLQLELDLQQ